MELAADDITRITAYLDATTPLPAHADLLFVFGSRWRDGAERAAALYHEGRAPYIVLTGGDNRITGHNEAQAHYDILVAAGVPADRIMVEDRSTNTLENVTFALPLIEQTLGTASLQSVLAVCKWMHSRRALMTLKRHLPRGIRYYAATYEPNGVTRDNWHLNARAEGATVLKHWESIPRYLEARHIDDIVRDGDGYV